MAFAASVARPRLMPRFEDEFLEVLVHPLGAAFDVGQGDANSLINWSRFLDDTI